MTGLIGYAAIVVALTAASAGAVFTAVAARKGSSLWLPRGETLALAMLGLVVLSAGTMVYALVTHNFEVEYVAQVGSRKTPLLYTIISLWSALEGSILLWAVLLAAYTCAVVFWRRKQSETD